MKTLIITLLAIIGLTMYAKAQTIPNSGFELWQNVGGWYFNPESWETNNSQIMTPVLQDTNSFSGNYALTLSHAYSSVKGYAKSRFPLNGHTQAIKVYVKCEVSTLDTVSVQVDLFSNRQIIDNGMWTSAQSISEWTLITIPINPKSYYGDSLEIRIVGGDSLETSFSLDEFSFDIISGIDNSNSPGWILYPNPFEDKLKYKLPGCESNVMILFEIIDIYGRTVARFDKFSNQGEIGLSGMASGAYVMKISTGKKVMVQKILKQ